MVIFTVTLPVSLYPLGTYTQSSLYVIIPVFETPTSITDLSGSKAYEEHGLLVAGGLIVGYGLAVLVVGIVGITRFFIPF